MEMKGKAQGQFLVMGLLILALIPGLVTEAASADYPTKPISILVQLAPGGSTDLAVRKLADLLEKDLNVSVLVVNKPGGAGTISTAALKNSKADGYTLGTFSVSPTCIIPHFREVPYNAKEDFTPVIQWGEWGYPLGIKADSPWNSFKELLEYARRHPEEITFGTAGAGQAPHLFMEQLCLREKVKMKHVPFQGGAPAITALLGGHIKAALVQEVAVQSQSGTVRALAVTTEQRMKSLPQVPTFRELGYDIECASWVGFAAPKGVPEPILQKLEKSITAACGDPSFKEILYKFEMLPTFKGRDDFTRQLIKDHDRFGVLLKELNIRLK